MPLFQLDTINFNVQQVRAERFEFEKQLQTLVEKNLEAIFGVRFIASEFVVRGEQPGRIDTLGLDFEGAPTIIEYKRGKNENVINQGLYYMNWLVDHRGDFIVVARDTLGNDVEINWSHPRLIIIAQNYAKWDTYAVNQMGAGVELWEYVLYGKDLLYLNQVYGKQHEIPVPVEEPKQEPNEVSNNFQYTLDYHLKDKSDVTINLFQNLRDGIFALATEEGEILETPNKLYISYRHGKNFCEVQLMSREGLKLHLDINIFDLHDPKKMARDVSSIGHWGTGATEVRVKDSSDLDNALYLIEQAYRMTL